MKRIAFHCLAALGLMAFGLPGCAGEVVDPDVEEVGEAEEAACPMNDPCEPPPEEEEDPGPMPDLVAAPPPPGGCGLLLPNTIKVTVKNIGTASAGSSVTQVKFSTPYGPVYAWQLTPALGVNQSVDLYYSIPAGFLDNAGDHVFTIKVDSGGQVVELNEGNLFERICLG
jgi:hypothetical protein